LDKPEYYVSHLLGHEGEGSLLSYLKKEGLANALGAGTEGGREGGREKGREGQGLVLVIFVILLRRKGGMEGRSRT